MLVKRSAALVVFVLAAYRLFAVSYAFFKWQKLDKATARLTLYTNTVKAELESFAHIPFLLSLDPKVTQMLADGDPERLNKRLARIAQSAGVNPCSATLSSNLSHDEG